MAYSLNNRTRLGKLANDAPLVTGGETIAVFGAGGQIGSKIFPELKRLYGDRVLPCDITDKDGMNKLDVTKEDDIRQFIKTHNVKVIINLAALLSAAAQEKPELAHKINFLAPRSVMDIARQEGVRKVMTMSSIAAQEFDEELFEPDKVTRVKKRLHHSAPTHVHSPAKSSYGQAKTAIEADSRYYTQNHRIQAFAPRLAGVLNCHYPNLANGTTEELDSLVIAAAVQAVYKDKWEDKMHEILARHHGESLQKGHYLKDGKYVPEVSADTAFDMVDGQTLAKAALLILHQDISPKEGAKTPDPVQNVSEYVVSMKDAVRILKGLNREFKVDFVATEIGGLDAGKMHRAKIWPRSQNTAATKGLIGPFKEYDPQTSIAESYRNVVKALQAEKEASMVVKPAPRSGGRGMAAG